jgi:hypothetical protein
MYRMAPAINPRTSGRLKLWGRLRSAVAASPRWLLALLFYALMAVLTIGQHAIGHPRTVCACVGTEDPAAYMWALAWWPHAIVHGLNPFVSHYLWSPTGVNLAQAAMIPTAAIAIAPITAVGGPVLSYNVLAVASPALAAFTAYMLCRRLVQRELPALAGGYLFGFSAYEFSQLTGHLNLTLIFLIPVAVHLALRRFDGELSRRGYIIGMGLLLVLQAGLSTELLADGVVLGALLLVAAWIFERSPRRARVGALALEALGAGLLALIVVSPFLYYALFSGGFPKGPSGLSDVYGLDLLNPLFPTYTTWLGHRDFLSLGLTYEMGNITEADGYLGIPIVAAFVWWLARGGHKSSLGRLLLVAVTIAFVAALGSHLQIAAHQTVVLPFNLIRHLPIFDDVLPSRIALFVVLAVSIGVASWLALANGRTLAARWVIVLLGAVLIFPNLLPALYGVPPRNPQFFRTSYYRRYLERGETVLVLPFGRNDTSMLWQAETGFYFYMPEGYVSGVVPSPFATEPVVAMLEANLPPPALLLQAFLQQHYVSHVVVDAASAGPWPGLLAQLGLRARLLDGVLLYRVPRPAS